MTTLTEVIQNHELATGDAFQLGDTWHQVAHIEEGFDHECPNLKITTTSGAVLWGGLDAQVKRIPSPILQALKTRANDPYRQ